MRVQIECMTLMVLLQPSLLVVGGYTTEDTRDKAEEMEVRRINAYSIRMVRTELGKMLRKDYESHKIHHGFNEHRVMEIGGGTI